MFQWIGTFLSGDAIISQEYFAASRSQSKKVSRRRTKGLMSTQVPSHYNHNNSAARTSDFNDSKTVQKDMFDSKFMSIVSCFKIAGPKYRLHRYFKSLRPHSISISKEIRLL